MSRQISTSCRFLTHTPVMTNFKSGTGKPILHGHVDNGLYRLYPPTNNASSSLALSGVRTSLTGWHKRLAHPHETILRRLVSRFQLPTTSNKLAPVCEPCQFGKSHRLHLSHSHVSSSKPFELLYSDVCGPSPLFSINGSRYFVLFVDDFTKFVWIYFLSHKSQVLSTFITFRTMIKNQFGCDVKNLQSDWGGEFRNVSTYLHTHGINHRLSCPYTPEQNGAVERRNRVIVEKGLSLLAQSSLPQEFWEHAFKTATYLHNRTITPTLGHQSPYSKLYDKDPDYAFLRSFGCLCYPFLRPYTSHKMDFHSLPCTFIGYSASHKGYLCYHPPTSRIYISRYVVFNEEVFPFATMRSQPSQSVSTSPVEPVSSSILHHASAVPDLPAEAHNPPSTSPVFTPPEPMPTTPPSHQRPTISSQAKQVVPSHYRPAANNQHSMVTRASTNSLKPKSVHTTTIDYTITEPRTVAQAFKHTCWLNAMKLEYDALMRNNTWSLVSRPCNVNPVGCKWIFRIKRCSDGSIERYKARLVARGFSQEEGVNFFDTFSPVIKPTTIRLVLSIALSRGWEIRQLDINNAFLNGDLSEEVYMEQPRGFEDPSRPHHVCRLHKAIYGLKQAPRAWFTKLKHHLTTQGFQACQSDNSLFVYSSHTALVYILVYVDDVIITGDNAEFLRQFIAELHKTFALKDLGHLNYFLGVQIQRTPAGLTMSQKGYIQDVLLRSKMADCKPISTLADSSSHLIKSGDPFSDSKLYRQVVGSLQYATITRPDIAYAVNRVCQYMHSPTTLHWQAVKRILRYLNGTLDHCLHFQPTNALSLLAYSDAGWISDKDDSHSQYGFAVFHGRNLISWTSRKQRVVARSSTEAEYRALAYTSAELLWINQLLRDLRVSLHQPPVLLCDNIGATFMCKNPVISSKSKHINLDFHFVREQVETGALKVSHVSSSDQLADIFTKALGKDRIAVLRSKLQVKPALQLAGGNKLIVLSSLN